MTIQPQNIFREARAMEKARALALVTILQRDLPGLVRKEIAQGVADDAEAREVLAKLLRIFPSEMQAEIERRAEALDGAALKERLEAEIRAGSKTAARMLLGLVAAEGGRN
jgi:hypothetical protein